MFDKYKIEISLPVVRLQLNTYALEELFFLNNDPKNRRCNRVNYDPVQTFYV